MKHFRNAKFFVLCLLIPAISYAQVIPDSLEIKVDAIFQEYNNNKTPGCAVAIVSNGKAIINKAYGMANLEHNIPIAPTTVFDIASVSKQFTGLAIATLLQEGKISEADDIRKYLPELPDFGKTISINYLLHHTSGLRDWPEAFRMAGWRPDDVCSFDDIMRLVLHQKELDFEPGTRFSYSNTGYNLLAAIVERVSGKTLAQWVHENIFSKLNMEASLLPESHRVVIKNCATSYALADNKFIKCSDLLTAYGSSSVFTSLEDMIRWSIHFDEQVNLKNPTYLRMLQTSKLNSGDTVYYGFGLGLSRAGALQRIAHSGAWSGFRSITVYYPEKHLSLIVLSNAANFAPSPYLEKIADIMLQRKTEQEIPAIDWQKMPTVKVAQSLMEKYVGAYKLGADWYISITMEDNQLMSRSNGEKPYPMIAKSDSTFWVDAYNNAISIVKDSGGYMIKYKTNFGKRITAFAPDANQLKQYAGKYYSEELSTEYILTVADGKLSMYHLRLGDVEMFPEPVDDNFGSEMGTFRFVRNEKLDVCGFYLSGSRVKNIHFDKQ